MEENQFLFRGNSEEGNAIPSPQFTSLVQRAKTWTQQEWTKAVYEKRSTNERICRSTVSGQNYRGGTYQSFAQIFPHTQERWKTASHSRRSQRQRAMSEDDIQDGGHQRSQTNTKTGRQNDNNRSTIGLQSSTYSRRLASVSGFPSRNQSVPVQGSGYGSQSGSLSVDTTDESRSERPSSHRNSDCLPSGRLRDFRKTEIDRDSPRYSTSKTYVSRSDHLKKESVTAFDKDRISWHEHQFQGHDHFSTTSKNSRLSTGTPYSQQKTKNSDQRFSQSHRKITELQLRNDTSETTSSTPPSISSQNSGQLQELDKMDSDVSKNHKATSVMGSLVASQPPIPNRTRRLTSTSTSLDRQQQLWMGLGTLSRRTKPWFVQQERKEAPYQCKGSNGAPIRVEEQQAPGLYHSRSHRQPSIDFSSQKRVLNQECTPKQTGIRDSTSSFCQSPQTNSHIHKIKRQLLGGSPQPTNQQARLETEPQIFQLDSSKVWDSQCRRLRFSHKPQGTKMVFQTSRTRFGRSQCTRSRLVHRASPICERPMGTNPTDSPQNSSSTTNTTSNIDPPSVENQSMVAAPSRTDVRIYPSADTTRPFSPSLHCTHRRCRLPEMENMDCTSERGAISDKKKELYKFLDSCLAMNTQKQYNSIWNQYDKWLTKHGLDHNKDPELIACYVKELLESQKYAANTLHNRLIELKRCLPENDRRHVSLTMLTKCIAKFGRPPNCNKVHLELDRVWTSLQSESFSQHLDTDQGTEFAEFSKRVVFLIALCNGGRANCLAEVDASRIQCMDHKYVLPVGNSDIHGVIKTTKHGKQHSLCSRIGKPRRCLEVYNCPHLSLDLNPYALLKKYLSITENWRQKFDQQCFIWTTRPTKGPKGDQTLRPRAARAPTLSRWFQQVMTKHGLKRVDGSDCKGHDVRRLSISLLLKGGFTPHQVKDFLQLSNTKLITEVYAQQQLHVLQKTNPSTVVLQGFQTQ